jgi:methyltransferase (TIGR00027 family)
MRQRTPSRTAEYMAFFRGLESTREMEGRLFVDRFAASFVQPGLQTAIGASRHPWLRRAVEWYVDRRLPGARTSGTARTRLIDDTLGRLATPRIGQLVILGAGFDCRALRLKCLKGTTVFEVDHPATLLRKVMILRRSGVAFDNVRHVEMDFRNQDLGATLASAGFRACVPTIFLWEGVTNYLTKGAVEEVLRYVVRCAAGTHLIFTYIDAGLLDGSVEFHGGKRLMSDVEKLGEPWTFGLAPEELGNFLKEHALILDFDFCAEDYRRRYYGEAAAGIKGYEFYHVACAHVPNEAAAMECAKKN